MIYPCDGILLSNKKERIIGSLNNRDETNAFDEEARPKRLHTVWFHLFDDLEKEKYKVETA